jgi:hypothetical protein
MEERAGGEILHSGTVCFVDTGARVIGVTAEHVYRQYLLDREADKHFVCQFGDQLVWPEARLIDRDRQLDLATFDLPELARRKERFLSNRTVKWPPPRLNAREAVIYGGYPGASRQSGLWKPTFAFETVTGFVHEVTLQNVVLFVDYQNIYWPGRPEGEELNTDPAGVSGGPVYYVDETASQYSYLELAGFIYEYHVSLETMLARHADVIRADGTLTK